MSLEGFEAMTIQDAIILAAIFICIAIFYSR